MYDINTTAVLVPAHTLKDQDMATYALDLYLGLDTTSYIPISPII